MVSVTGEVIQNVGDLQAMDVDATKDKEKQKKEAKYIHLRKRKALADLFKYLQNMGKLPNSCKIWMNCKISVEYE